MLSNSSGVMAVVLLRSFHSSPLQHSPIGFAYMSKYTAVAVLLCQTAVCSQ